MNSSPRLRKFLNFTASTLAAFLFSRALLARSTEAAPSNATQQRDNDATLRVTLQAGERKSLDLVAPSGGN